MSAPFPSMLSSSLERDALVDLLMRCGKEHSTNWFWKSDAAHSLSFASRGEGGAITRFERDFIGKPITHLLRQRTNACPEKAALLASMLAARKPFSNIEIPVRGTNKTRWWSLSAVPVVDKDGVFAGYVGIASECTKQHEIEQQLQYLALHDGPTGLSNRSHFSSLLDENVARLERYGIPFCMMFLDLDKFKTVNDTRGHLVGDRLLAMFADRLRANVGKNDVVARLGGDEFAIIQTPDGETSDASATARRLIRTLSAPYEIDGECIKIGVSIGIAIAPLSGTRPDQLRRNTDLALYRAKERGGGAYCFYQAEMDSKERERRALEFDVKQALDAGEFSLDYQPIVAADTQRPVGLEALLRWRHPIRDWIPPIEFIPLAEQTGAIHAIGEWVLMEACRTAAAWPGELRVAVNLSPQQFEDGDRVVEAVRSALAATGLSPERLELEITESVLIGNPAEVVHILKRLKEIGVWVAMDDFGTGFSSLAYLLKFPFDKIKIDRSFVGAIGDDKAACDILRTISVLGQTLGLTIVAEGVETPEQVSFLRSIACDQLQGYHFSKPLKGLALKPYLDDMFPACRSPSRELA